MTTETHSSVNARRPPLPGREFRMAFTSTPRGARLARRLTSQRLDAWGHPYDSRLNTTVTLIVAELAANAVTHGRVPGRDFHLRLRLDPAAELVRVEVTDTRDDRLPPQPASPPPAPDAESGRGLCLVAALATRWAAMPRENGGPGKTVWAEVQIG
ncbi:ATP-binding protein [Streptomyces montanisoli]|uniref:ATP-binding protein n=1 Tax=Streptomyces montanisoli TaxID=2798581 RepID=A0A940MH36_9ACTN|nr:ATP-binding protein [Streptomyces montanisoli]MBP0459492.1 ATP-binding protein [Streptomyces montanisoli]